MSFWPILAWKFWAAIWPYVPIVKVSEVVGSEQLATKILIFDCTDKKRGVKVKVKVGCRKTPSCQEF